MNGGAHQWGVIGGGLLGMTVAHTLAKKGESVTLFEAAPACGGLAGAWQLGDIVWDRHYHVTLLSDSALRGLLTELGLDSQMRWKKTRTGFYHDGSLYPFSNALDFARFPVLNSWEKFRLASTIFRASRLEDWQSIEGLTVEQWLTSLSGPEVFRKIWKPLLLAKLGEDYQVTSATFLWATIRRLYAARRNGLKEELFGYLPGGYAHMLETFHKALVQANVQVRTGAEVVCVDKNPGGGLRVQTADGESRAFSKVVVTLPAPLAARVCRSLPDSERHQLRQVQYIGIICASVLLRTPLTPFYVTNILDRQIPFTGLIEMSALVDPAELGGHGLLYIPRYLRPDHPDFNRSDEELKGGMLRSLRQMHPTLRDDDILAFQISRVKHVFPLPTLRYSQSLPSVQSQTAGLSLVNSAHIVNGTLNANETVALGQKEALRLHATLN